jgi:YfiH family protein
MPFLQTDEIRYHTFESLEETGIVQATIARQGGVSPQPWASLNVGGTVGDETPRVIENRRRSFRALGRKFESLYDVWQVHGTEVVCTDSPRPLEQAHLKADAILTDQPGVTLFMRFADCVPIFLYDPIREVVGLVHAGWQGTVKKTAAYAVRAMQARYQSRPQDILAGIGPSIGPDHYEVGPEVVVQVREAFGDAATGLLKSPNGGGEKSGVQFDLWRANQLVLEEIGVQRVEIAGICTACNLKDWYSHRGEKGKTGRFGALISL